MANCKICNDVIPEGTDICNECNKKLVHNDEQYLDQLLALVTGNQSESYQHTENLVDDILQSEYVVESISYTEDELQRQNSKDDDWNLLNQTMNKQVDKSSEGLEYSKDIPAEGALDEVESIFMDDYGTVLQEIAIGSSDKSEDLIINEDIYVQSVDESLEQDDYIHYLVNDGIMEHQEEIMDIPDNLVAEDMQNPLVDEEVIDFIDNEVTELYNDSEASDIPVIKDESDVEEVLEEEKYNNNNNAFNEDAFLSSLMDSDLQDAVGTSMDEQSDMGSDSIQELESDNSSGLVLDDELSELHKLLGEVTENADDFRLEHILSNGAIQEEDKEEAVKINTADILKQSLSAVSDLDDPSLEAEFINILPTEKPTLKTEKISFFKKLFSNVHPENPEEELIKEEQEEALLKEKKQLKEEEKQKKAALKQENKEKKAAMKESKQKQLADEKENRKKARDAIAAAYVPEGKINKAGAFVVFVFAACVAIFIIQGTSFASYHLSIKSAEKDLRNSRYDEAYETLSGETLKEKDEIVYDKLQTIMVVKKELNSYYNFKKMNMELEALDSIIKGIDRYERYYANAKELKVDKNLNSLKDEMISILKNSYKLSEKDAIKLIDIKDAESYTERLTTIVSSVINSEEVSEQLVQKNK